MEQRNNPKNEKYSKFNKVNETKWNIDQQKYILFLVASSCSLVLFVCWFDFKWKLIVKHIFTDVYFQQIKEP